MDSLTQIALGAAIGQAGLGKQHRARGAVYGAICGTLPDLDVLWPLADPVASFTYHRSYSHSLLVLTLLAPIIVWLIRRFDQQIKGSWKRWLGVIWLVLITHPLLDCLTVYGTQIFLPFSNTPVSGSVIFVIDPIYTLPLLLAVGVSLSRGMPAGRVRAAMLGLSISSLYLCFAVAAKFSVDKTIAEDHLARQLQPTVRVSTPAPLTTLVWRVVSVMPGGYEVSFVRPFGMGQIASQYYPSTPKLLEPVADSWAVQRLQWFTHGAYRVRQEGDEVVITDLRMGLEDGYAFSFAVARNDNGRIVAIAPKAIKPPELGGKMIERLKNVFRSTRQST